MQHFDSQANSFIYFHSIWINELQNLLIIGHAQAGPNPEICSFFTHLATLASTTANFVFVFDGPQHLPIKCGKHVIITPHWMVQPMKDFIDAFGFYTHMVRQCYWWLAWYLFLLAPDTVGSRRGRGRASINEYARSH